MGPLDPLTRAFLFGVAGAASVEVLRAYKYFQRGRGFPNRYRALAFYPIALLMTCVGGLVAVANGATTDALAFQLGLTAPLVLERLSRADDEP